MHKYLKSIGFSNYKLDREVDALLDTLAKENDDIQIFQPDHDTSLFEIKREVAPGVGIAMYGRYTENEPLRIGYYHPYMDSNVFSSDEECTIQRHAEKETYAGMLDEYTLGVSLIFYLLNPFEYRKKSALYGKKLHVKQVQLVSFASEGMVLLPVRFSRKQRERYIRDTEKRNKMLKSVRDGDAEAMEALTLSEYDLFNQIVKRVENEDIYSIVDMSFMPSGLESDQYKIIGYILEVLEKENRITQETIYDMVIGCNGINFRMVINKKDLLGEPAVGRRFKGKIWMQGIAEYDTDSD